MQPGRRIIVSTLLATCSRTPAVGSTAGLHPDRVVVYWARGVMGCWKERLTVLRIEVSEGH